MKITGVKAIFDNGEFVTLEMQSGSVIHLSHVQVGNVMYGHSITLVSPGILLIEMGEGDQKPEVYSKA